VFRCWRTPVCCAVCCTLQVALERSFKEQQDKVEAEQAQHTGATARLASTVAYRKVDMQAAGLPLYQQVFGQVVDYVCAAAGLEARAASDPDARSQVSAAVESVLPLSSLAYFLTLPAQERMQQVRQGQHKCGCHAHQVMSCRTDQPLAVSALLAPATRIVLSHLCCTCCPLAAHLTDRAALTQAVGCLCSCFSMQLESLAAISCGICLFNSHTGNAASPIMLSADTQLLQAGRLLSDIQAAAAQAQAALDYYNMPQQHSLAATNPALAAAAAAYLGSSSNGSANGASTGGSSSAASAQLGAALYCCQAAVELRTLAADLAAGISCCRQLHNELLSVLSEVRDCCTVRS
jgi:hypothetical protein